METSESIRSLIAAMAKAQSEMTNAVAMKDNPYFKSKYADLGALWDVARGPLSSNGLCIIQSATTHDEHVSVTTRLCHSSGEWIEDSLSIKLTKNEAQGIGSAITYGRRYSLSAFVGLASVEDDDGNAAVSGSDKPKRKTKAKSPDAMDTWIKDQHDKLNKIDLESGVIQWLHDNEKALKKLEEKSLEDYIKLINHSQERIAQINETG